MQEIRGRMLREQLGDRLVEDSARISRRRSSTSSRTSLYAGPEPRPEPVERTPVKRDGERGRIGEGGLIKKRQRREGARDEALDKLSTRPDRPAREGRGGFGAASRPSGQDRTDGPKPDRKFEGKPARAAARREREQPPIEPPGQRKANVWMARRAADRRGQGGCRKGRGRSQARPPRRRPMAGRAATPRAASAPRATVREATSRGATNLG